MSDASKKAQPGFWSIFFLFFGISSVIIGGGYVMVPVIQRAIARKGWLAEDEFYDLFALAQALPGPIALNAATFAGRRLAGLRGLLAGFLGVVLPPFVAILLVAVLLDNLAGLKPVQGFLKGAYAVVPGLVSAFAVNMVRKRNWTPVRAVLTCVASIAMIVSGSWAIPVFFVVAAVAWLSEGWKRC
ncbi:MAG TPA: chromate transporter [Spirochaetales bacterium]|nr:chromate transporter [Spirochaetales bacterium]